MKEPEITEIPNEWFKPIVDCPEYTKSRLIEHLQSELARKDEEIEAWQGMYIEARNEGKELDQPRVIY